MGISRWAWSRSTSSGLFAELNGRDEFWAGLSRETTMGFVHLHVAHLPAAEAFYIGVLGF